MHSVTRWNWLTASLVVVGLVVAAKTQGATAHLVHCHLLVVVEERQNLRVAMYLQVVVGLVVVDNGLHRQVDLQQEILVEPMIVLHQQTVGETTEEMVVGKVDLQVIILEQVEEVLVEQVHHHQLVQELLEVLL